MPWVWMVNSLRVGASLAVRANFLLCRLDQGDQEGLLNFVFGTLGLHDLECRGDLALGCAASIAGRQELTSRGEGRSTLPECVDGRQCLQIATRPNAVALEVRLLAMDQMLMDVMRIVGFKGDFPCRPAATKVFKQMAAR